MNPVIAMLIGVVVMMGLIIFTRMHAFPSLIISAILIGILSGIPLGESISTVTSGFGGTMASIGIVIGFGCIMGIFLEKSGAAKRMALTILKMVGVKRADVVLGLTGFVVSIPVFCDSGFVILNPHPEGAGPPDPLLCGGNGCSHVHGAVYLPLLHSAHTRAHCRCQHHL